MNTAATTHYPAMTTSEQVEARTLCVLVDNEPGVLARVIGLFAGRGYNIDSLTVSETEHERHLSRITIVTRGTPMVIEQIKNQLERLVPVHRVIDLTISGPSLQRELAMVKVRGKGEQRMEMLRLADAFRARVIDATNESFVFEITGASDKIESFVNLMLPLGLVEVSRTGVVAIGARTGGDVASLRRAGRPGNPAGFRPAAMTPCGNAASGRGAHRRRRREPRDQRSEPIEEALQEFPRALVADPAFGVHQVGLERNVGLSAQKDHAETGHDRAQMLLRERAADGAWRGAGDEGGLAGPGILAVGPRAPVDGVFQDRGNGAIMLRRQYQHAVGLREFAFETDHFGREVAFIVLVVHRQVVDPHELRIEGVGAEFRHRVGQFAVDRIAAVAADNDGDAGLCHIRNL